MDEPQIQVRAGEVSSVRLFRGGMREVFVEWEGNREAPHSFTIEAEMQTYLAPGDKVRLLLQRVTP